MSTTYDEEYGGQAQETAPWEGQPIPVVSATVETAPEYGSTMTYAIPQFGVGLPIQVLTRRIRRHKAYVEVNFVIAGSVIFNSKLDSLSIPAGYTVNVPVAGLYRLPDWETQQPLYCVATVAGLSVSVIDMSYGERSK
jgi:hypothetical protein